MRKKLLKLSAQDRGESRRLWQHVTEALSKGDVDTASKAKHIVSHSIGLQGRSSLTNIGKVNFGVLFCNCVGLLMRMCVNEKGHFCVRYWSGEGQSVRPTVTPIDSQEQKRVCEVS